VNDEGGDVNVAFDHERDASQSETDTIPNVAKRLKARNQPWALVVDENYGEGSAREHAALQPRFYGLSHHHIWARGADQIFVKGCAVIIARSFARIHETNLKKQGVLPLWFENKADYSRIASGDVVETLGLSDLLAGKDIPVKVRVTKRNGEVFEVPVQHTMSGDQLKWLEAGSALNHIRAQMAEQK
jgi:homoaconitase